MKPLPSARPLQIDLPRPVSRLHQIELSSRCDLRCVYCPSPKIHRGIYPNRAAVDMTRATFERALVHVRHHVRVDGQDELNLAGIGESTLHPEFALFVRLAREAVGPDVRLVLATNGVQISKDPGIAEAIAPYRPMVWVSLHRPERAGLAVETLKRLGLMAGVSVDPSVNSNSWAGQVSWPVMAPGYLECPWIRRGQVMAMSDGRVTRCCLDSTGGGVLGHVIDPPGTWETAPWPLCTGCHQRIDVEGWDQPEGRWA